MRTKDNNGKRNNGAMNRNMLDRLMATAKGMAWGVVILILMQMCYGCKSSKQTVTVAAEEHKGVQVIERTDSLSVTTLADMHRILTSSDSIVWVETDTYYSTPDEYGKQHVIRTTERRAQQATSKTETTTHSQTQDYRRMKQESDSAMMAIKKTVTSKETAKRTSGGVGALEELTAIVLIIIIVAGWLWCRKRGYLR